jgi:hypothetical protein
MATPFVNYGLDQPGWDAGGRDRLCLKTEIHGLSHMPWDLTVKFEKPASAVFAGDTPSGG